MLDQKIKQAARSVADLGGEARQFAQKQPLTAALLVGGGIALVALLFKYLGERK